MRYFLLLLMFFLSCDKKTDLPKFTIQANIHQLPDTKIYLANLDMETNKRVYVDSTFSQNGEFQFTGSVESPYLFALFLGDDKKRIDLFIENMEMKIIGDFNDLSNIQVIGSPEDSIFRPWFNYKPFDDRKADLELILNHSNSHVAPFVAFYHFQTFETSLDTIEMIIESFGSHLHGTIYFNHLIDLYSTLSTVKVGEIAPGFSLADLNGKMHSLSDFKGRYIFLDFWAEWCSPCRKTNKELIKIYPNLNMDSIEFISISLDETREAWERAIKQDQLTWVQLSDLKGWESQVGKEYGIRAIPQNFLINPNGKIIGKNIGYNELNRFRK